MEKKQTAVEWLIEQIKSDQNQKALSASEWMQVIEQAKTMEKEQCMVYYKHGQNNGYMYRDGNGNIITAEQYYNELMENKQTDMNFELVRQTSTQRFYKCDTPIKNFPRKQFDWSTEIEYSKKRLKERVEMLDDECFYVCVSDAHTHVERLVFAAGRYKKSDGEVIIEPYSMLHIDGSHTMMIHGGDIDAVYPDEVYLRRIKMANK